MRRSVLVLAIATLGVGPALANETTTYTYDANGRLVTAVRSGTVNNGVNTTWTFDAADNRTKIVTLGGFYDVIVVPISGMTLIPILDK